MRQCYCYLALYSIISLRAGYIIRNEIMYSGMGPYIKDVRTGRGEGGSPKQT